MKLWHREPQRVDRLQFLWGWYGWRPRTGVYAPASKPELHIFRWWHWGPLEIRLFPKV